MITGQSGGWSGKGACACLWLVAVLLIVASPARAGIFLEARTLTFAATACAVGQTYDPLGDSKETDPRDDGTDLQGDCPCPPKDCGDQGGGLGLHVKYANGNVWTEVHVLTAYGANEESLELSLYYNSLLVTPEVTDPNISLPLDRGMGLGWSHSLDL